MLLEKNAGFWNKTKNYVQDFTGKNADHAHKELLEAMDLERKGKVPASAISQKIRNESLAHERKYHVRRQVAGVAGGTAAAGTTIGLAGLAAGKKEGDKR